MSQDKEEYEVGIPLNDLTPEESPPEPDSDQIDEKAPEDDGAGLPALFDEEELAEVGLKASPFDEDGESSEIEDDLQLESEIEPPEQEQSTDPDAETEPEALPYESDEIDGIDDALVSEVIDTPPPAPSNDEEILPEGEIESDTGDLVVPTDIQIHLDAIMSQLTQLKDDFEGKLKYDAHKDEIIDKLHQELQEYKQDIVKKHILSIVLDVVKVADDIRKWITYFKSLDVSQRDPIKLFRYLEAIPSDLEDIFYWQGVKPYSNSEGAFDPATQRTIKKIPTDDISKDKTIAKSLRSGYEWEGKVIRQEMVAVYVYDDEKESVDTRIIDE